MMSVESMLTVEGNTLIVNEGVETFWVDKYCDGKVDYKSIKRIELPESLGFVQRNFQKFTNLESVIFHEDCKLKSITSGMFKNLIALREVKFPKALKEIGMGAFEGCALEELSIECESLSLGVSCFARMINLKRVKLKALRGKVEMQRFVFDRCNSLESVIVEAPEITFKNVGNNRAFNYCENLKSVELKGKMEKIPKGLFFICTGLREVVVPEGVKVVEDEAFFGCKSLEVIELPDSLEKIEGNEVFTQVNPEVSIKFREAYWTLPQFEEIVAVQKDYGNLRDCVYCLYPEQFTVKEKICKDSNEIRETSLF